MLKSKAVALLGIALAVAAVSLSAAADRGRVLMLVRAGDRDLTDFMIEKEVTVMASALKESGFTVVVATPNGEDVKGSKQSLKPDLKAAGVRLSDYKGLVLPCMAAGQALIPAEYIALVKQAAKLGKPIAAQNSAVEILAQAGVLKGRKFAIEQDLSASVAGGTFAGIGVVQDGKIVTSGTCPFMAQDLGKPDGTAELTKKLIALML